MIVMIVIMKIIMLIKVKSFMVIVITYDDNNEYNNYAGKAEEHNDNDEDNNYTGKDEEHDDDGYGYVSKDIKQSISTHMVKMIIIITIWIHYIY